MLDTFAQDLRIAVRKLVTAPGFTLAAVLSLTLALGANTVVFSLVYGILLRSLPYEDPERLVLVWEEDRSAENPVQVAGAPPGMIPLSILNLRDYAAQNRVLEGMSGFFFWNGTLAGEPSAERVDAAVVYPNLFELLGVEPVLGRGFLPGEEVPGKDAIVTLGYGLWQNRFGGDPDILGKTIRLDGEVYTVVGVMPPEFDFPGGIEVWKPFRLPEAARDFHFVRTIARLKKGISLAAARTEMSAIARRLEEEYPDTNQGKGIALFPLAEQTVGNVRPVLLVLQGAIAVVLLIACVNVSNLLLFRSTLRQGEVAVRTVLGAGRGRLIRQLLTEALVLATCGGAIGLLLAYWSLSALLPLLAGIVPRVDEVRMDPGVLAFSALVSVAAALTFGLIPALYTSRPDFGQVLKAGLRVPRVGLGRRLQELAVVTQVALALALVIGAGLLVKSFNRLLSVDPGFRPENVLTLQLTLMPQTKYGDQKATAAFYTEMLRRVESLPGVEVAGATWRVPMGTGGSGGVAVEVEGRPGVAEDEQFAVQPATPGLFEALGIPLRAGRTFTAGDDAEAPPVVIVNEALAQRLWPGESAVGKRLTFSVSFGPAGNSELPDTPREVIGVVGNVRHSGLDQPAPPLLYFPYYQGVWRWSTLAVRTTHGNPASLAPAIRKELEEVDPEMAPNEVRTLEDLVARSMAQRRVSMILLSGFAGIALVLAAVGIYGVVSYAVSQRTTEIGIRMALGARGGDVVWLVLRRALLLGVLGVAIGLAIALGLTRYLAGLLYEVGTLDLATFTAVAAVLLVTSLLASYVPVRRATRVGPAKAIRYD
jgi:putative ABC transport system permease protein